LKEELAAIRLVSVTSMSPLERSESSKSLSPFGVHIGTPVSPSPSTHNATIIAEDAAISTSSSVCNTYGGSVDKGDLQQRMDIYYQAQW